MADYVEKLREQRRKEKLAREYSHISNYNNDLIRAQRWQELSSAPGKLAQGAFTGLAGAPVDIASLALRPFGLGSERPIGGSNQLASLINAPTESAVYQAGTMLPIGPEGLALGGAKLAGLAGIFASKGAKTANLAELLRAEEMAKAAPAKTEFELAHEVAQRNAALPVEQGGLGLHPDNTAMDRAKAMGFDTPAYHGRNGELYRPKEISDQARALRAEGRKIEDMFREKYGRDSEGYYRTELYKTDPLHEKQKALFDQATKTEGDYWIGDADISGGGFDVSKTGDIGTHLALDPMVSSKFAEHGAVMPLLTKSGNLRRVEDVFSIHLGAGKAVDELYRVGILPEKSYDKFAGIAKKLDSQTHLDQRDWGEQKGLIDFWKKLNKQVTKNPKANLIYDNEIEGGGDSLSILNPSTIRSRFAAFDPMQRNSANILAGGAAGAIGLSSLADLMYPQDYGQ